jgi:hypothetical protein
MNSERMEFVLMYDFMGIQGRAWHFGATASLVLIGTLSACSNPLSGDPGEAGNPGTRAMPMLGVDQVDADAHGMTTLVVGDSMARSLGTGMAEATGSQNKVVNAAQGGCGIMLSSRQVMNNKEIETPTHCNSWPSEWPKLVKQYKPDAVLLTTSFWDSAEQVVDGTGKLRTMKDPVFRARYDANMDKAIKLLSNSGAKVFIDNLNPPGMLKAQNAAVERNSNRGARSIDLYNQMCSNDSCPPVIDGIKVLDETGHPTPESRKRLGAWILNKMHAELSG